MEVGYTNRTENPGVFIPGVNAKWLDGKSLEEVIATGKSNDADGLVQMIIAQPVAPDGIVEGRLWLDTTENASGTLVSQSLNIGTVGYIDNPVQSDFKGQAMITLSYDDGLTNSYKLGLPMHEKYGIPATFNITSGNLNDIDNIYMTKDQVKDLYHRGVEIASHGNVHSYAKRYTQLTDTEIRFECTESIRLLKEASGASSVDTMAIIYSDYDERVKAIVKQYFKGVRVYGKLQNSIPPADRYWINSTYAVSNTTTFEQVKAVIDNAIANKKWCVLMMHSISNGVGYGVIDEYVITQKLLSQICEYIALQGRDKLLPINTRDALKYSLGVAY